MGGTREDGGGDRDRIAAGDQASWRNRHPRAVGWWKSILARGSRSGDSNPSNPSINKLQAELDLSRVKLIQYSTEGGVIQDPTHQVVVRVVQRIKKLRAHLQLYTVTEQQIFGQH